MNASPQPGIVVLDDAECWKLLGSVRVGRIAVDIAGKPDIFPINFVVDDGGIVFRTGPGTKLAGAVLSGHVAFEVDGFEPEERMAWSVVVKGRAHEVDHMEDRWAAEELPLFPWVATPKPDFVRITPDMVTGRRFHIVDEVVPDESLGWHRAPDEPEGEELAVEPDPGEEYHPGEPYLHPD